MTSFDANDIPVRHKNDVGEFTLLPATGLNDARASDAGRSLMELFHERSGGKRLLRRNDFSPLDLKPFLTNIIILDVVYGEDGLVCDGIVRLMGSAVATFYGENTGTSVLAHPSSSGARFIAGARAAIECQKSVIGTATQALPNRPLYRVVTCMTPVANADGTVVQMLGLIELFS